MRLNRQALLACLLVSLAASGTARAADKIKIKATEPKTSKDLSRGQEITLRVAVEYELKSAEAGSIALLVQEGQTAMATVEKPPVIAVKRGRGEVALETVLQPLSPSISSVRIFASLIPHAPPKGVEGPGPHRLRTPTVDHVSYKVR